MNFHESSEAAMVDGVVNDSITDTLIDTGAFANLMEAKKLYSLDRFVKILSEKDRFESVVGKTRNFLGRAILELKLGSICMEVHVLVLLNLKPQMIFGEQKVKRHGCTIDFRLNELWAGGKGSMIVVMHTVSLTELGSYGCCRKTEFDPSMQDTKLVTGL